MIRLQKLELVFGRTKEENRGWTEAEEQTEVEVEIVIQIKLKTPKVILAKSFANTYEYYLLWQQSITKE